MARDSFNGGIWGEEQNPKSQLDSESFIRAAYTNHRQSKRQDMGRTNYYISLN